MLAACALAPAAFVCSSRLPAHEVLHQWGWQHPGRCPSPAQPLSDAQVWQSLLNKKPPKTTQWGEERTDY